MRAVTVSESSQVGEARRVCVEVAQAAGFDPIAAGRAAIVATELASNLVKHGGGGELLVGTWNDPGDTGAGNAGSGNTGSGNTGIDVLALDRGPGMRDAQACLRDGYSSAGTSGNGLGAVRRLSRYFAVHAPPGGGTAVLSRLAREASPPSLDPVAAVAGAPAPWGAVRVPVRGETVCGDAWAAIAAGPVRVFLVADGLGHGVDAARAADEAAKRFHQAPLRPPAAMLEAIHLALRPTRGAAIAIARVELHNRRTIFAGIGNIVGALVTGTEVRRMVSHNGIAGHQMRRIQEFEYPFPPGSLLVMHSDGLTSAWSSPVPAPLAMLHPVLAAGLLYRDHARGRDDCCVLVAGDRG